MFVTVEFILTEIYRIITTKREDWADPRLGM
jgi:hypothetical protein